jgi:hypothetical protein
LREQFSGVASYTVNERAVERAVRLIEGRQYILASDWGDIQPNAAAENAYLESHSWDDYGEWHLGLTEGASEESKGAIRIRLRRLQAPAPNGDHRLPLPGSGMATQRD